MKSAKAYGIIEGMYRVKVNDGTCEYVLGKA